jgi:bifunctional non-homologous end joining protein LigD
MTVTIRSGRREVEISRPDKALFPNGVTKLELARYYDEVAEVMLPHLEGRPLNLERFPDGIEGQRIMQQRAGRYFPDWIKRIRVPKEGGTVDHVLATEPATLVYLAGQACVTLHRWLSRADRLDRPNLLVVDLDPSDRDPASVQRAARIFGALMRELDLEPWVMSTGSRGYHVVTPVQRRLEFDQVRAFARDLGTLAVAREPHLFTLEQRKAKRDGRILVDIMRNGYGQTAVSPYAVRPRPTAPVATPLAWEELDEPGARPDMWTIRDLADRLRSGDPWREIGRHAQSLTRAHAQLDQALAEVDRASAE